MSKFGRKFIIWIVLVIVGLGSLSMVINTVFVERYYLKTKNNEANKVYKTLEETSINQLEQTIEDVNKQENMIVFDIHWDTRLEKLNDDLKIALGDHGISIKKFWLWEEDAQRLEEGESVSRLYNQGKLNYSLLIKFLRREDSLVVISNVIPHATQMIKIINVFTFGIWISSLLLMIILLIAFIRRTTKPLMSVKELADDIAHLRFRKIQVHTGDELEELANSINRMSDNLKSSHEALENKNNQMTRLLSDVSHELKTPIALIKAYSSGIEDGMDDGTFLTTIVEQNDMMHTMVEQLLHLSRIKYKSKSLETVNISQVLEEILENQQVYFIKEAITVAVKQEDALYVAMNPEELQSVLTNFITNAIKYTQNKQINIVLRAVDDSIYFEISNGVNETIVEHLAHLWEPFYVGEASRNKELCGTGLGLSIVHELLEKYGGEHSCKMENEKIVFYMYLDKLILS